MDMGVRNDIFGFNYGFGHAMNFFGVKCLDLLLVSLKPQSHPDFKCVFYFPRNWTSRLKKFHPTTNPFPFPPSHRMLKRFHRFKLKLTRKFVKHAVEGKKNQIADNHLDAAFRSQPENSDVFYPHPSI